MHFWNDSKDIWWHTWYKIYFQEQIEKELLLSDTARSKWYHLTAQRETNIVKNQLPAVLHTYIHIVLLLKLVLRKIQQSSCYLQKIPLHRKTAMQAWRRCRSCSDGWPHRLIQLVYPTGVKLEYRNKETDHHTPAKHAGFKNTGGWIQINPSILSWLSFSDRKMIFLSHASTEEFNSFSKW